MIKKIEQSLELLRTRKNSEEVQRFIDENIPSLEIRMDSSEVIVEHNYISISLCSDVISFLSTLNDLDGALEIEILSCLLELEERKSKLISQA